MPESLLTRTWIWSGETVSAGPVVVGDPVAVVVLGLFVVYEIYRATQTGSVLLPVLAAVDVAIIVMIVREYRLLRATRAG